MLLFIDIHDCRSEICKRISKHLMLLFIFFGRNIEAESPVISKHLMLLFIRYSFHGIFASDSFQNISCCYLSSVVYEIVKEDKKFQNISCCYLSLCIDRLENKKSISKHLMLLFIFVAYRDLTFPSYFKTSHVAIYPTHSRAF